MMTALAAIAFDALVAGSLLVISLMAAYALLTSEHGVGKLSGHEKLLAIALVLVASVTSLDWLASLAEQVAFLFANVG